jgi:hypothetical protein
LLKSRKNGVFCCAATVVVVLGFTSGNNDGLGATKHAVSIGLGKKMTIKVVSNLYEQVCD